MSEPRSRIPPSSTTPFPPLNPSAPLNGSANAIDHEQTPSSPIRSPLYHPRYAPTGQAALSSIALQSLFLGVLLGTSLVLSIYHALFSTSTSSSLWRVPLFVAICGLFHFLEFYSTAQWNSAQADRTSFLIVANGVAQGVAYAVALMEVGARELGRSKGWWEGSGTWLGLVGPGWAVAVGMLLVVVGQGARSLAMREAGASFNHLGRSWAGSWLECGGERY